jgi:hypothetical protein
LTGIGKEIAMPTSNIGERLFEALTQYEFIQLLEWRVEHHRRRNLWQAMADAGLT